MSDELLGEIHEVLNNWITVDDRGNKVIKQEKLFEVSKDLKISLLKNNIIITDEQKLKQLLSKD